MPMIPRSVDGNRPAVRRLQIQVQEERPDGVELAPNVAEHFRSGRTGKSAPARFRAATVSIQLDLTSTATVDDLLDLIIAQALTPEGVARFEASHAA